MTTPETSPATAKPGMPPWAKKAIGIAVMAVVLVIAYFILAAFLPRWWAQRIASLANGSFSAGIAWGLLFGLVCTLVPLIFFRAVWQVRKRKHARIMQITALALGVIFALPNLLSLTVVLGNNNAAHAGERILDVDGPGFRGASVVGAVLGVALFLGLVALGYMYKKRGKDLDKMRGELKQHEPQEQGRGSGSGNLSQLFDRVLRPTPTPTVPAATSPASGTAQCPANVQARTRIALTGRTACSILSRLKCRECMSHTKIRNIAAGIVTAADAANVEMCASPTASSTATSMPAPMAAADPNTK